MPSPRWPEIAALFDEFVELAPLDQSRRLAEVERTDPVLAAEVRALLAADDSGNALLDANAAAMIPGLLANADATGAPADGQAGPYRLLGVLGEGGMGVVWLGERMDGEFEQQVAVKVLKRGMDTHAILRRFLLERRILARLHHKHIVRLIDAGTTTDGRPFYVMDRVDGLPITGYAAAHAMDVRARVALLAQVADAVAYAHTQLIVHRDLKPSNVLVDAAGEPRVLDFGIAKLIEESGEHTLTGTGLRALSPAYAAPEQILGEPIGTTTDVYALGLMLCELLVGQLPRQRRAASAAQLAQQVAQETIERASTLAARLAPARIAELYGSGDEPWRLAQALSGDLDVIIAKALQREPARRYVTAAAFADDLRLWLDGRPISARAESASYRLAKFARRHRFGVAAAALIAISVVGGLGVALWQAKIARAAAEVAESERAVAQRQLARTERVKDFVLTLFHEADPMSRAKVQARTPAQLIADGIAQTDGAFAGQPDLKAELLRDLGEIQLSLGDRDAAKSTLEQAWQQQKALSGSDSAATAEAQASYAGALLAAGDAKAAEPLLRSALDRLRATLGPDHLETVDAEAVLGRIDMFAGRLESASTLLQHGADVTAAVHGAGSSEMVPRLSALVLVQLARSLYDDAAATARKALQIVERNNGVDNVRAIIPHSQIADALRYQTHYPEALEHLQAAARICRAQLPARHPLIAGVLVRLGDLLRRMHRYDEAEQVFAEGLDILKGSQTGEYAQTLQLYAALAEARGQLDVAIERYRAAFTAFRAATGDSTYTWLTALLETDVLIDADRLAEAEKRAAEAAVGLAALPDDAYEKGYAAGVVGHLRFRQRRYAESVAQYRQALKAMQGEEPVEVAERGFVLARSLVALDDEASRTEARILLDQALPVIGKADPTRPLLGEVHLARAELRLRSDDRAGAQEDVVAALPLLHGFGADQRNAHRRAEALASQLAPAAKANPAHGTR